MIIPYMGIIVQGKGLWRALFTRTQRRLLGLLYGYPERSFFANELVRLAGVGTGSVQRELKRLTAAGILKRQRVGNQTHYQANPACPFYPELRSIVVKTFGALDRIRQALRAMQPRPGLAMLFGDSAQGLSEPEAPLQLLVSGDGLRRADLDLALAGVSVEIGRHFEVTLLSSARLEELLAAPSEAFQRLLDGPRIPLLGRLPPD